MPEGGIPSRRFVVDATTPAAVAGICTSGAPAKTILPLRAPLPYPHQGNLRRKGGWRSERAFSFSFRRAPRRWRRAWNTRARSDCDVRAVVRDAPPLERECSARRRQLPISPRAGCFFGGGCSFPREVFFSFPFFLLPFHFSVLPSAPPWIPFACPRPAPHLTRSRRRWTPSRRSRVLSAALVWPPTPSSSVPAWA